MESPDSHRSSICSDSSYMPSGTPSMSNSHSFASDAMSSDGSRPNSGFHLNKIINSAEVQRALAKLANLRDKYEHERIATSSEYASVQLLHSQVNTKLQQYNKKKLSYKKEIELLNTENAELETETEALLAEIEKIELEIQYNSIKKQSIKEEIRDMLSSSDRKEIEKLKDDIKNLEMQIKELETSDSLVAPNDSIAELNLAEEEQLKSTISQLKNQIDEASQEQKILSRKIEESKAKEEILNAKLSVLTSQVLGNRPSLMK
ncbi:unnamed protein product [Blepharisma stoltei]|uniref:Uncharacterized protein n=1 Tax=Blepharisma stoltei TaxID=1481888 RepID=A0AAU9JIB8_9CILI|nr:unnamed protein product [Blepharisma stoltei]